MAKRRNKKQQIARKRQQQKSNRPANRLEEAMGALKAGDYHSAITQGASAYEAQNDEVTQRAASQLLNESYFRVAAKTTNMLTRLRHLDSALKYMPDDSRSHLHRGNTLVGMGRLDEALAAFQKVDPATLSQTKMNYPVQLARMAAGEKWFATGLSSIEANTLYLLESIIQDAPDEEVEQCIEQMDKDDSQATETAIWKVLTQMYQKPKSAPQSRLQNAVADNGTQPVLSYYLGVMSMRKGEIQPAKEHWEKAAVDGFQSQWLSKNQALLLSEEAQKAAATGTWQEIIKSDYPSHLLEDTALGEIVAAAHDHLGYAAAKQNKWDKASRHWRKASESLQNRRLLQNLALSAEKTGNWSQAAESWRGVVRRRPRKTNHPDYLTDMQVAAIWHHAADCYREERNLDEVIHCLKNAIKYAPEDTDIRISLAQNYIYDEREEAAENELNRILDVDSDNIHALELLGRLYTDNWHHDDMEIWRRILEIEPAHLDARQALADAYVKKSDGLSMSSTPSFLAGFFARRQKSEKSRIKWLEEGLEELPGHPKLLMELGLAYIEIEQKEKALDYLEQARQAASNDLDILAVLAVSLLEMEEEEALLDLRAELRELPRVTVMFWLRLANQTLSAELEDQWVQFWGDEAITVAREAPDRYSIAYVLARLAEMSYGYDADEMGADYEKQIQAEAPKSGAAEYVVAFKAYHLDDMTKARRMLQRGKTRAKRANEKELLEHMEMVEMTLFSSPLSILRMLEEGDIDIPPDFFS